MEYFDKDSKTADGILYKKRACGYCNQLVAPNKKYTTGRKNRKYPKPIPNHHPCECGCGKLVASNRRFVHNHHLFTSGWHSKINPIPNHHPCACGCSKLVASNKKYILGHNPVWSTGLTKNTDARIARVANLKIKEKQILPIMCCQCGCGKEANSGKKYIWGHNSKTKESKENNRNKHLGITPNISIFGKEKLKEPKSEAFKQNLRKPKPEEFKNQVSKTLKRKYKEDKVFINNQKNGNAKTSETLKRRWKDPEFAKMMFRYLCNDIKPNKPESFLLSILNEYWPGQWEYTGDYSVIINGKNPDFVNEEQKLVIEHFGDYWHKGEDPTDRAEIFSQAGYDTCVIWESELKNLDNVIFKIKQFMVI